MKNRLFRTQGDRLLPDLCINLRDGSFGNHDRIGRKTPRTVTTTAVPLFAKVGIQLVHLAPIADNKPHDLAQPFNVTLLPFLHPAEQRIDKCVSVRRLLNLAIPVRQATWLEFQHVLFGKVVNGLNNALTRFAQ